MPHYDATLNMTKFDMAATIQSESQPFPTASILSGESTVTGDGIDGKATLRYLSTAHPGSATPECKFGTSGFNGLIYFNGTIGGKTGTVVFMCHKGFWDGNYAHGELIVEEKTATGGLQGIKGTGSFKNAGGEGTVAPALFDLEF